MSKRRATVSVGALVALSFVALAVFGQGAGDHPGQAQPILWSAIGGAVLAAVAQYAIGRLSRRNAAEARESRAADAETPVAKELRTQIEELQKQRVLWTAALVQEKAACRELEDQETSLRIELDVERARREVREREVRALRSFLSGNVGALRVLEAAGNLPAGVSLEIPEPSEVFESTADLVALRREAVKGGRGSGD